MAIKQLTVFVIEHPEFGYFRGFSSAYDKPMFFHNIKDVRIRVYLSFDEGENMLLHLKQTCISYFRHCVVVKAVKGFYNTI